MKLSLLKFTVSPINNIGEGILKGSYSGAGLNNVSINLHSHYTYEGGSMFDTDFIPHKKKIMYPAIFRQVKDVYLVPISNSLGDIKQIEEDIVKFPEFGLKVCEYAPNYLLGLMSMFSGKNLPKGLPERVDIVAVDRSDRVMTRGEKGWLHVQLMPTAGRYLGVFKQSHISSYGMQRMILAENL